MIAWVRETGNKVLVCPEMTYQVEIMDELLINPLPEDTIKGQMYYDLGFDNWTFELEQTEGKQITDRLREVWTDYPAASAKLKVSMDKVSEIYAERVDMVKETIESN